jgi:hypothetical protein
MASPVINVTGAPEVRPVTALIIVTLSEVQCQFCGSGGCPGRADRLQGHALGAPDSELTVRVPAPLIRVPPHWVSSEEAVMKYAQILVLPQTPPGGLTAGIDWASADHVACVVDAAGQVRARFSVTHDRAASAS